MRKLAVFVSIAVVAVLNAAPSCDVNPPLASDTSGDRFLPKTDGSLSGTLSLKDATGNYGFDFPEFSDSTQFIVSLYRDPAPFPPTGPGAVNFVVALDGLDRGALDAGTQQDFDYSVDQYFGLFNGTFAAILTLDVDGDGQYDSSKDCSTIANLAGPPGDTLPVAVTIDDSDETLNMKIGEGPLYCPFQSVPASTGTISGTVSVGATVSKGGPPTTPPNYGTPALAVVSLYRNPAPGTVINPGSLLPDYSKVIALSPLLYGQSMANTSFDYSIDASASGIPEGNYAIHVTVYNSGAFGAPGSNDCVGTVGPPAAISVADGVDLDKDMTVGFCFP